MNQQNAAPSGAIKSKKRSIFGLLFNPRLGTTVTPLGEGARIFLQLLATVFSLYGLLPKDYPGLRDTTTKLSLAHIMGTAWQNVQLTREGAPRAVLFFAILGIMISSLFFAIAALFGLFIGHAHAQAAGGTSEFMLPGANSDVAQAWINYLFLDTPLPNYYNQMGATVPTSLTLQAAFIQVLAFYSDAILIIAAMILFYHLTAMVMETAHHGQVMGKRANQMWAPIRLVVAIGLLVPINTGLNSGQYIVIKMAEVGSALATNAWNLFLTSLTSYNQATIAPQAPNVTQLALDMMSIYACADDYNQRVNASLLKNTQNGTVNNLLIPQGGNPQPNVEVGGVMGTRYNYGPNQGSLSDQSICGWFFIPSVPATNDDNASAQAYAAEASAFNTASTDLYTAATTGPNGIRQLQPTDIGGTAWNAPIQLGASTEDAILAYQVQLGNSMTALAQATDSTTADAVNTLKPYGWVFAGALFQMVARIQAMISNAVTAGVPQAHPPEILNPNSSREFTANPFHPDGSLAQSGDIRKAVANDLKQYTGLITKTWEATTATNVECAAMIGLQGSSQGTGFGAGIINPVFMMLDQLAQRTGVWTSVGGQQPCGGAAAGLNTFNVGIQQINGGDPLAEIAKLGHSCLDVAAGIMAISLVGKVGAGVVSGFGTATGIPGLGAIASFAPPVIAAIGGLLDFFALIFMTCGLTLAFILPMFPFTRFFFAVLVWVAAVLEAVVAVPLIALAHLNPEGEGLPGASARPAYYYVFNILLRPILCLFGLACGMLLFLIATSFLTYAFNLGVASSGGTAYGHEFLSKFFYTIIYVAMLYVCANHSFALVDHIPEKALSWMGAQAQSMAHIGNPEHIAKTESLIGSYAGQKMSEQLGNAGNQLGSGLSNAGSTFNTMRNNAAGAGNNAAISAAMSKEGESLGKSTGSLFNAVKAGQKGDALTGELQNFGKEAEKFAKQEVEENGPKA